MKKENTPRYETERLILRKFTENDVHDVLLIYGDPQVNEFLPWFIIKNIDEAQVFLKQRILSEYTKEIAYYYALELKATKQVIGYIGIGAIGKSNDLGYGLRKEYWHQGIISEGCNELVKQLKKTDIPFITATHDIYNKYSGEVMKKIGMHYVYTYEERVYPKNHLVTFRMYQLNFKEGVEDYQGYSLKYEKHYIEKLD